MSVTFYPVIALGITRESLKEKQIQDLQELIDNDVLVEFQHRCNSAGDENNVIGCSLYKDVKDFTFMTSDIMITQNHFNKIVADYPSLKNIRPRLYLTMNHY